MEDLYVIGLIAGLHLLALVSPGPDLLMVIRNPLSYSRRVGIYTSIGLGLGISVHIMYCLAGLALIISKSILIFNIIKILGASYLIYIGIKSLFSKSSRLAIESSLKLKDIRPFKAIKIGFFTNILNPKATLFFLSLFTVIIPPNTSSLSLAIASVIMVISSVIWFSVVSSLLTQKRIRNVFNQSQDFFNKIFGALLVALGIKIALFSNNN